MASCQALKYIAVVYNVFLWIAGVFLLILGALIVLDPSAADFFSLYSAHANSFRLVGWLVLAAGTILTFTGFCGYCGAWKDNKCCLLLFFAVLLFVFSLELTAAVLANTKQERIRSYVEDSMYDAIRTKYAHDSAYKAAIDKIQTEMKCCGVRTYKDWLEASWEKAGKGSGDSTSEFRTEHGIGALGGRVPGKENGRVPFSCCNENGLLQYPGNCGVSFYQAPLDSYADFLNDKGCSDALYDMAYSYLDWVIGGCVLIGILQLIGMVLAAVLICCRHGTSKNY
ncbi:unnamed protein product [Auanema sp. JU1783]|nr:unnamed protein product [Auanema sp. JU1783]